MTDTKHLYTHRVAVNTYLIRDNRFLMLKRSQSPQIWSPPGGRLRLDEDPMKGLIREVKEETQLDIKVVAPVNIWFGIWQQNWLLSIDYLAYSKAGEIILSEEHNDYRWVSLQEIEKGVPVNLDPQVGFKLSDFQEAWKIHLYQHDSSQI
ncbi:MAG: NUDIX hydrolase [Calditrichia bacterium]|nr:NUDIX hydrolase [Calditrichia bacterium]